MEHQYCEV